MFVYVLHQEMDVQEYECSYLAFETEIDESSCQSDRFIINSQKLTPSFRPYLAVEGYIFAGFT